jgi:hypothetical protein
MAESAPIVASKVGWLKVQRCATVSVTVQLNSQDHALRLRIKECVRDFQVRRVSVAPVKCAAAASG